MSQGTERKELPICRRALLYLLVGVAIMCSCREPESELYWRHPEVRQQWEEIIHRQPPELVAKARKALNDEIAEVWEWENDWLSKRVFNFVGMRGKEATFLETDGDYVQVNCPSGIPALNEILSEYTFTREDFDNREKVHDFLEQIEHYYGKVGGSCVGSSIFLETDAQEEVRADWLQGREKNEAVFKSLCKDPHFKFEGNKWSVTFNVFEADGSVDKWEVTGEYDTETQSNKIYTIDISRLKRKGTFYYPIAG